MSFEPLSKAGLTTHLGATWTHVGINCLLSTDHAVQNVDLPLFLLDNMLDTILVDPILHSADRNDCLLHVLIVNL